MLPARSSFLHTSPTPFLPQTQMNALYDDSPVDMPGAHPRKKRRKYIAKAW